MHRAGQVLRYAHNLQALLFVAVQASATLAWQDSGKAWQDSGKAWQVAMRGSVQRPGRPAGWR